jgi:hypothetical protein
VTFGASVGASLYVPFTDCTIEADPGLFFPEVMMGQRDKQIFALYGQSIYSGGVSAPVFPTNGIPLLVGAIGADGGLIPGATAYGTGQGVTGASLSTSTTLSASAAPGARTITVASAASYAQGDIIQIGSNSASGTIQTAECRMAASIAGSVITLDVTLNYAHDSGAAVKIATGLFTHTIIQQNLLPSWTIEKCLGGYQSEQYVGCRVGKYDMKCEASNTEVNFTADIIGKGVNVLDTPSTVSVINEAPYIFAGLNLYALGASIAQAGSLEIAIDNALKPTYTFNQSHDLQFLTPTTRQVNGTFDAVFTSLDDADWGYFSKMLDRAGAGTQGSLVANFAGAGGTSLAITLAQINLSKYADDLKLDDVIMSSISYEGSLALGDTPPTTISAIAVNVSYLPY